MKLPESNFVRATRVRRAVVPEGDIRGDIEFQNDINGLLARMDGNSPPLRALDWAREAVPSPAAIQLATVERAVRVLYGGNNRLQAFADQMLRATVARRA